jgi:hypothetical protein
MKQFTVLLLLTAFMMMGFTRIDRGWQLIGDKWANYSLDRDELKVTGNDIYTKLKIRVTDAPLNMHDMDVVFENGERQNFVLQRNFSQGEWSRVLDLAGNRRRIDKIIFKYDTKNVGKGKARVAVWGKR